MTKLLIVLIVVFAVVAIAQLAKIYEISARIRGKREEKISNTDNKVNGNLMLLFMIWYFAFFIWQLIEFGPHLLPIAASEHGVAIDKLMNFNWVIIFIVFFITNTLLFIFAFKYRDRPGAKAFYYPHNNKLELVWTVIPAVTLAVIIIYGLRTWNEITEPASEEAEIVEFYSKQFDWTARYPGPDGKLGPTDFRLISGSNPLGIATEGSVELRLLEMKEEVEAMKQELAERGDITPGSAVSELHERMERLGRHRQRLLNLKTRMQKDIEENGAGSVYRTGEDDIVIKEAHLPVRKEVNMVFRSQDVIHSAYLPHFRTQMNTVPGMSTTFKMVPTITTDSMRLVMDDPDFNYVLLCNKICGASHYNMQMDIVVESEAAYREWLGAQKSFFAHDLSPVEEKMADLEVEQELSNVPTELAEVEVVEEQE